MKVNDFIVRNNRSVDRRRGFVLHAEDYKVGSLLLVSEEIFLSLIVDILRAISARHGLCYALIALGYSFEPGQFEAKSLRIDGLLARRFWSFYSIPT